ncbi:hypothetical protein PVS_49 [Vibrio phage vB_VspS_VS-ABTNL-3]|nr:hypothetical protein PVS_49 [Vibrio phage vB_VspS_VS-ABTNL-3]
MNGENVMSSLQTKIKKIPPAIFEVLKDFSELEPGQTLEVKLVWGTSIQSLYQKIYRTVKIFEACKNDSTLAKSDWVQRVNTSFEGYATRHNATTLTLIRSLDAAQVINDVITGIEKSESQQEMEAETDQLMEEMAEEIAEVNEDFIRDDEESIDKGLPPSAGDDWLDDDDEEEDDLEGDPDILKYL